MTDILVYNEIAEKIKQGAASRSDYLNLIINLKQIDELKPIDETYLCLLKAAQNYVEPPKQLNAEGYCTSYFKEISRGHIYDMCKGKDDQLDSYKQLAALHDPQVDRFIGKAGKCFNLNHSVEEA